MGIDCTAEASPSFHRDKTKEAPLVGLTVQTKWSLELVPRL